MGEKEDIENYLKGHGLDPYGEEDWIPDGEGGAFFGGFGSGSIYDRPSQNLPPSFKEGDDIIYMKNGSDKDGMKGKFLKMRDDGKYIVIFDDGKRFAANANNIQALKRMKK